MPEQLLAERDDPLADGRVDDEVAVGRRRRRACRAVNSASGFLSVSGTRHLDAVVRASRALLDVVRLVEDQLVRPAEVPEPQEAADRGEEQRASQPHSTSVGRWPSRRDRSLLGRVMRAIVGSDRVLPVRGAADAVLLTRAVSRDQRRMSRGRLTGGPERIRVTSAAGPASSSSRPPPSATRATPRPGSRRRSPAPTSSRPRTPGGCAGCAPPSGSSPGGSVLSYHEHNEAARTADLLVERLRGRGARRRGHRRRYAVRVRPRLPAGRRRGRGRACG